MVVQLKKDDLLSYKLGSNAIYEHLRDQVVSGVYAAGERIPSTRALAKELGVSRTTICVAYDQLAGEGFISVRQGAQPKVALSFPARAGSTEDLITDAEIRMPLSRYGKKLRTINTLPQLSPLSFRNQAIEFPFYL